MTPTPRGSAGEPYRGSDPYAPPPAYPPTPYEPASGTYDDSYDDYSDHGAEPGPYATRERAQAASLRRSREEARRRGLRVHWFLAGGSVGTLLLVVLALQMMPITREGDRVASRLRLPRIELARRDSADVPTRAGEPELHSATTPAPVETVVPPRPRETPADSSATAPEDATADSADGAPGR